ncbi:MAG TPA: cobalamin-dependent protein [Clostridia bacterium]|nr:cobalamin-dependent protein [Clostridia bacterium]
MENELIKAVIDLDEDTVFSLVSNKINNGESTLEIVEQCRLGVKGVGEKYSQGVYFLSDLIMSEEIFKNVMNILEPHFPVSKKKNEMKIVIGTIEGDIHDLGKNIVSYLLRSVAFEVFDLGIDVSPERFVEELKDTGSTILGISVLLTSCVDNVKKVVDILDKSGIRDNVTVVIGGYPVNHSVNNYVGADYFTSCGIKALKIFKDIANGET